MTDSNPRPFKESSGGDCKQTKVADTSSYSLSSIAKAVNETSTLIGQKILEMQRSAMALPDKFPPAAALAEQLTAPDKKQESRLDFQPRPQENAASKSASKNESNTDEFVNRMVKQLGSDSFQTRERGEATLVELAKRSGHDPDKNRIRELLEKARKNESDPEIQRRLDNVLFKLSQEQAPKTQNDGAPDVVQASLTSLTNHLRQASLPDDKPGVPMRNRIAAAGLSDELAKINPQLTEEYSRATTSDARANALVHVRQSTLGGRQFEKGALTQLLAVEAATQLREATDAPAQIRAFVRLAALERQGNPLAMRILSESELQVGREVIEKARQEAHSLVKDADMKVWSSALEFAHACKTGGDSRVEPKERMDAAVRANEAASRYIALTGEEPPPSSGINYINAVRTIRETDNPLVAAQQLQIIANFLAENSHHPVSASFDNPGKLNAMWARLGSADTGPDALRNLKDRMQKVSLDDDLNQLTESSVVNTSAQEMRSQKLVSKLEELRSVRTGKNETDAEKAEKWLTAAIPLTRMVEANETAGSDSVKANEIRAKQIRELQALAQHGNQFAVTALCAIACSGNSQDALNRITKCAWLSDPRLEGEMFKNASGRFDESVRAEALQALSKVELNTWSAHLNRGDTFALALAYANDNAKGRSLSRDFEDVFATAFQRDPKSKDMMASAMLDVVEKQLGGSSAILDVFCRHTSDEHDIQKLSNLAEQGNEEAIRALGRYAIGEFDRESAPKIARNRLKLVADTHPTKVLEQLDSVYEEATRNNGPGDKGVLLETLGSVLNGVENAPDHRSVRSALIDRSAETLREGLRFEHRAWEKHNERVASLRAGSDGSKASWLNDKDDSKGRGGLDSAEAGMFARCHHWQHQDLEAIDTDLNDNTIEMFRQKQSEFSRDITLELLDRQHSKLVDSHDDEQKSRAVQLFEVFGKLASPEQCLDVAASVTDSKKRDGEAVTRLQKSGARAIIGMLSAEDESTQDMAFMALSNKTAWPHWPAVEANASFKPEVIGYAQRHPDDLSTNEKAMQLLYGPGLVRPLAGVLKDVGIDGDDAELFKLANVLVTNGGANGDKRIRQALREVEVLRNLPADLQLECAKGDPDHMLQAIKDGDKLSYAKAIDQLMNPESAGKFLSFLENCHSTRQNLQKDVGKDVDDAFWNLKMASDGADKAAKEIGILGETDPDIAIKIRRYTRGQPPKEPVKPSAPNLGQEVIDTATLDLTGFVDRYQKKQDELVRDLTNFNETQKTELVKLSSAQQRLALFDVANRAGECFDLKQSDQRKADEASLNMTIRYGVTTSDTAKVIQRYNAAVGSTNDISACWEAAASDDLGRLVVLLGKIPAEAGLGDQTLASLMMRAIETNTAEGDSYAKAQQKVRDLQMPFLELAILMMNPKNGGKQLIDKAKERADQLDSLLKQDVTYHKKGKKVSEPITDEDQRRLEGLKTALLSVRPANAEVAQMLKNKADEIGVLDDWLFNPSCVRHPNLSDWLFNPFKNESEEYKEFQEELKKSQGERQYRYGSMGGFIHDVRGSDFEQGTRARLAREVIPIIGYIAGYEIGMGIGLVGGTALGGPAGGFVASKIGGPVGGQVGQETARELQCRLGLSRQHSDVWEAATGVKTLDPYTHRYECNPNFVLQNHFKQLQQDLIFEGAGLLSKGLGKAFSRGSEVANAAAHAAEAGKGGFRAAAVGALKDLAHGVGFCSAQGAISEVLEPVLGEDTHKYVFGALLLHRGASEFRANYSRPRNENPNKNLQLGKSCERYLRANGYETRIEGNMLIASKDGDEVRIELPGSRKDAALKSKQSPSVQDTFVGTTGGVAPSHGNSDKPASARASTEKRENSVERGVNKTVKEYWDKVGGSNDVPRKVYAGRTEADSTWDGSSGRNGHNRAGLPKTRREADAQLRDGVPHERMAMDARARERSKALKDVSDVRKLVGDENVHSLDSANKGLRDFVDQQNVSVRSATFEDLPAGVDGCYRLGKGELCLSSEMLHDPYAAKQAPEALREELEHAEQDRFVVRALAQQVRESGFNLESPRGLEELQSRYQKATLCSLSPEFAGKVLRESANSPQLSRADVAHGLRLAESFKQERIDVRKFADHRGRLEREMNALLRDPAYGRRLLEAAKQNPAYGDFLFGEKWKKFADLDVSDPQLNQHGLSKNMEMAMRHQMRSITMDEYNKYITYLHEAATAENSHDLPRVKAGDGADRTPMPQPQTKQAGSTTPSQPGDSVRSSRPPSEACETVDDFCRQIDGFAKECKAQAKFKDGIATDMLDDWGRKMALNANDPLFTPEYIRETSKYLGEVIEAVRDGRISSSSQLQEILDQLDPNICAPAYARSFEPAAKAFLRDPNGRNNLDFYSRWQELIAPRKKMQPVGNPPQLEYLGIAGWKIEGIDADGNCILTHNGEMRVKAADLKEPENRNLRNHFDQLGREDAEGNATLRLKDSLRAHDSDGKPINMRVVVKPEDVLMSTMSAHNGGSNVCAASVTAFLMNAAAPEGLADLIKTGKAWTPERLMREQIGQVGTGGRDVDLSGLLSMVENEAGMTAKEIKPSTHGLAPGLYVLTFGESTTTNTGKAIDHTALLAVDSSGNKIILDPAHGTKRTLGTDNIKVRSVHQLTGEAAERASQNLSLKPRQTTSTRETLRSRSYPLELDAADHLSNRATTGGYLKESELGTLKKLAESPGTRALCDAILSLPKEDGVDYAAIFDKIAKTSFTPEAQDALTFLVRVGGIEAQSLEHLLNDPATLANVCHDIAGDITKIRELRQQMDTSAWNELTRDKLRLKKPKMELSRLNGPSTKSALGDLYYTSQGTFSASKHLDLSPQARKAAKELHRSLADLKAGKTGTSLNDVINAINNLEHHTSEVQAKCPELSNAIDDFRAKVGPLAQAQLQLAAGLKGESAMRAVAPTLVKELRALKVGTAPEGTKASKSNDQMWRGLDAQLQDTSPTQLKLLRESLVSDCQMATNYLSSRLAELGHPVPEGEKVDFTKQVIKAGLPQAEAKPLLEFCNALREQKKLVEQLDEVLKAPATIDGAIDKLNEFMKGEITYDQLQTTLSGLRTGLELIQSEAAQGEQLKNPRAMKRGNVKQLQDYQDLAVQLARARQRMLQTFAKTRLSHSNNNTISGDLQTNEFVWRGPRQADNTVPEVRVPVRDVGRPPDFALPRPNTPGFKIDLIGNDGTTHRIEIPSGCRVEVTTKGNGFVFHDDAHKAPDGSYLRYRIMQPTKYNVTVEPNRLAPVDAPNGYVRVERVFPDKLVPLTGPDDKPLQIPVDVNDRPFPGIDGHTWCLDSHGKVIHYLELYSDPLGRPNRCPDTAQRDKLQDMVDRSGSHRTTNVMVPLEVPCTTDGKPLFGIDGKAWCASSDGKRVVHVNERNKESIPDGMDGKRESLRNIDDIWLQLTHFHVAPDGLP